MWRIGPLMQKSGEILHIAGSGRVIIKLTEALAEGQILCDRGGTKVAKVMEMIGPVEAPLASAVPLTNNIKKQIGRAVFASPARNDARRPTADRQKRNRRGNSR